MAFISTKKEPEKIEVEEINEGSKPSLLPPKKNGFSLVKNDDDLNNNVPQIKSADQNVNELIDKIKLTIKNQSGGEFDISLDAFIVEKIITSIIYSPRQKTFNLFNDRGEFIIATEQQLIETKMVTFFGDPIINKSAFYEMAESASTNMQGTVVKSVLKMILSIPITLITDYLTSYMQCGENRLVVDMFAKHSEIRVLRDGVSQITYKHEPYEPTRSLYNDELLNDYKEHFPMLDELLEAIVASRFAADRKKSFLWMRCQSDWGKGFFINRLSKIGAMYEMSVEQAKAASTGKPMGMRPNAIKRALVICFNEFSGVDKSLKSLENNIKLSPKHEMECTMDVYFKLFLSAQDIPSLTGEHGVESEFSNRFSYYRTSGDIDKRRLFKQFNNDYEAVVETYICDRLNSLIDMYIEAGEVGSKSLARTNQYNFFDKHKISNSFAIIEESINEITEEVRMWIIENSINSTKINKAQKAQNNTIEMPDKKLFVCSITVVIAEYIKEMVDKSDQVAVSKMKWDIASRLCVRGNLQRNRVNGVIRCGIWIR